MSPPKRTASSRKQPRSIASASKSPGRSGSSRKPDREQSRPSRRSERSKSQAASRGRSDSQKRSIYEENPDLHPVYLLEHVKEQNERHLKDKCDRVFYHDTRSSQHLRKSAQAPEEPTSPKARFEEKSSPEVDLRRSAGKESSPRAPSDLKSSLAKSEDYETLGLLARIKKQSELQKQASRESDHEDRSPSQSLSAKRLKDSQFKQIFQELYLSKDEFVVRSDI
jgi:hypothetical protein